MNILMLNYEFPPIGGGAGQAHLSIVRQFAQNSDLKVDVLTSAPMPGFFAESLADNVHIYKVGVHKKNLHHWRKMEVVEWLAKSRSYYRALLQDNHYDLVHAFFGFPTGWLCYRTAEKLPYIISLRGSDVPGHHARLQLEYKLLAPVFRKIWKKAAALVACSDGLKARALRFLPSADVSVIPNGVELERFKPAGPTERKDGTLKLLTVGRLSVTKRVEMLIDAVEMLHKAGVKVHFAVAGGGGRGIKEQLRQMVFEKNLVDVIKITGRVDADKMPDIYRQNDVFISASMQEGMSNAMLEAMASGLPIVTTRCEGVEELIADNGIVVEQPNADAIAQATRTLARDGRLYDSMRAAARRQAEKFSWQSVADQYINLYKRIRQK
jgi:glycosyltransferase involved in cell wall biosynthesis